MEGGLTFILVMIGVIGVPIFSVMVAPALARAIRRRLEGGPRAPADAERLATLERRLAELEERMDFAERVVARERESGRLGRGGGQP